VVAIEANGCYCGGGGKEDKVDIVVELGRGEDDPAGRLKRITEWLDARPDVQSWRTGEEFDIWQGDYQDIEDEIEPSTPPAWRKAAVVRCTRYRFVAPAGEAHEPFNRKKI
jgi:hypothetical protein